MHRIMLRLSIGISNFILLEVHLGVILFETGIRVEAYLMRTCLAVKVSTSAAPRCLPVASQLKAGLRNSKRERWKIWYYSCNFIPVFVTDRQKQHH